MRAYARKLGQDEERWATTALLHDFDWEIHPAAPDHPMKGEAILAERGVDEETRRAILSHANYSGVSRDSLMEKALFACDELAGFLTACSYVKPSRSIEEVDVGSVKRKLKDKAFARNVNREDIYNGAQELGVPLEEHIAFCIAAMKERAAELGLAPQGQSAFCAYLVSTYQRRARATLRSSMSRNSASRLLACSTLWSRMSLIESMDLSSSPRSNLPCVSLRSNVDR
jgi:predicted hydrolase (HD superfamily)